MQTHNHPALEELRAELAAPAKIAGEFPGVASTSEAMPAPTSIRRLVSFITLLFLLTVLIPPWRVTEKNRGNGHVIAARTEYHFVLSAPTGGGMGVLQSVIAFDVLAVEWLALTGAAALFLWLKKPAAPNEKH